MIKTITLRSKLLSGNSFVGVNFVVAILMLLTFSARAQQISPSPTPHPATQPMISNLRGVAIDMSADEVKEKLGKPKIGDKAGSYYEFSKGESAQIGLDNAKKVRTIALIFSSDSPDVPTYADVFGPDVPLAAKPNGSIYKLIRYPEAGYWVAYSRSAGEKPITIITMRRINKPSH